MNVFGTISEPADALAHEQDYRAMTEDEYARDLRDRHLCVGCERLVELNDDSPNAGHTDQDGDWWHWSCEA